MATLADVIEMGLKIIRSKLAPWQRLDALDDWENVDSIKFTEIKATLNLPQEASNEFLHGSTKQGCCCGLTLLAEDSDITAIDSAFKLLTSPDGRVTQDTDAHVREVTHKRIGRVPTVGEVGNTYRMFRMAFLRQHVEPEPPVFGQSQIEASV